MSFIKLFRKSILQQTTTNAQQQTMKTINVKRREREKIKKLTIDRSGTHLSLSSTDCPSSVAVGFVGPSTETEPSWSLIVAVVTVDGGVAATGAGACDTAAGGAAFAFTLFATGFTVFVGVTFVTVEGLVFTLLIF